jgi:4-hydroxyphenylpyruvate dioxygenase
VIDPAGIVESMALQDRARALRICLNASSSDRTLSSRFLAEFFGAGVQHIAFATADIFAAAQAIRDAGLDPLPIPENYYDDLEARLALPDGLADRLRALSILYDEDEHGRYFQVYTRPFRQRFFFEIVQRDGYAGFGAANAPIRLAAQARQVRGPALPRT